MPSNVPTYLPICLPAAHRPTHQAGRAGAHLPTYPPTSYLFQSSICGLCGTACLYGVCAFIGTAGPDPGFLDQGFKLAEGGSFCAIWLIFLEIPQETKII